MSVPSPCGLAISSVTSDGRFLYALQPDRKTVYRLDLCANILCTFKTSRKYLSIHYCGGKFYAVAEGDGTRIYVLSHCFNETGSFEVTICERTVPSRSSWCNSPATQLLFIGPFGECNNAECMLTLSGRHELFLASTNGRLVSRLSDSGRKLTYTAVAENSGILYEGLESTVSSQTFIRATLLSTEQTITHRLPFGYKVKGFFCHGGVLYAFITKNSFHAYIAAVNTFVSGGILGGEIISIPESRGETSCCEESCDFGPRNSKCGCNSACCSCSGVSSDSTQFCESAVSGDSTNGAECDISELCRLFNCLKKYCKENGCSCSNGTCTLGTTTGGCCNSGNFTCSCFPQCCCNEAAVCPESCLPQPILPESQTGKCE